MSQSYIQKSKIVTYMRDIWIKMSSILNEISAHAVSTLCSFFQLWIVKWEGKPNISKSNFLLSVNGTHYFVWKRQPNVFPNKISFCQPIWIKILYCLVRKHIRLSLSLYIDSCSLSKNTHANIIPSWSKCNFTSINHCTTLKL